MSVERIVTHITEESSASYIRQHREICFICRQRLCIFICSV